MTGKYVIAYHTVKYKFGDSPESLVRFADKHGMFGTKVLYLVKDDGSWDPIDLPTTTTKEEKK